MGNRNENGAARNVMCLASEGQLRKKGGTITRPAHFPCPTSHFRRRRSGGETPERSPHVAFTQTLQRAIPKLTHALARHAEHRTDLLEGVLAAAFESEIQPENLRIARRQRAECLLDFIR